MSLRLLAQREGITSKGRASARPISAFRQTLNLVHQTCSYGYLRRTSDCCGYTDWGHH